MADGPARVQREAFIPTGGFIRMRSRASALVLAPLLACALGTCGGTRRRQGRAGEHQAVRRRRRQPERSGHARGDRLRHDRVGLRHQRQLQPGAAPVPAAQGGGRARGAAAWRPAPSRSRRRRAKSKALGDSPNPYFNVWRSYSEPGGIADEMRAIAAANPDVMKLEQVGTTELGKPILVIKMTADARNTPDGTRPALLFAADQPRAGVGRGRAGPPSARLVRGAQERPEDQGDHRQDRAVVHADPERGRLRLHVHLRSRRRSGAVRLPPPPAGGPTASGARRCATTTTTGSTATTRTASTRTATTRPSAASTRRARSTASAGRPTAARTRCRSPATSPSTACSGA